MFRSFYFNISHLHSHCLLLYLVPVLLSTILHTIRVPMQEDCAHRIIMKKRPNLLLQDQQTCQFKTLVSHTEQLSGVMVIPHLQYIAGIMVSCVTTQQAILQIRGILLRATRQILTATVFLTVNPCTCLFPLWPHLHLPFETLSISQVIA